MVWCTTKFGKAGCSVRTVVLTVTHSEHEILCIWRALLFSYVEYILMFYVTRDLYYVHVSMDHSKVHMLNTSFCVFCRTCNSLVTDLREAL